MLGIVPKARDPLKRLQRYLQSIQTSILSPHRLYLRCFFRFICPCYVCAIQMHGSHLLTFRPGIRNTFDSDTIIVGEKHCLKLHILARHHSNHFHELL